MSLISQMGSTPSPKQTGLSLRENSVAFNQMRTFLVSVTLVNLEEPMLGLAEQQIHLSMQPHSNAPGVASAHTPHMWRLQGPPHTVHLNLLWLHRG